MDANNRPEPNTDPNVTFRILIDLINLLIQFLSPMSLIASIVNLLQKCNERWVVAMFPMSIRSIRLFADRKTTLLTFPFCPGSVCPIMNDTARSSMIPLYRCWCVSQLRTWQIWALCRWHMSMMGPSKPSFHFHLLWIRTQYFIYKHRLTKLVRAHDQFMQSW